MEVGLRTTANMEIVFNILFWIFSGLFGLKILWNISTPWILAGELLRSEEKKTRRVTLMPFVECLLLCIIIALSALVSDSSRFHHPLQVAIWGALIIIGSYVIFIVSGVVLGGLVAKIKN